MSAATEKKGIDLHLAWGAELEAAEELIGVSGAHHRRQYRLGCDRRSDQRPNATAIRWCSFGSPRCWEAERSEL